MLARMAATVAALTVTATAAIGPSPAPASRLAAAAGPIPAAAGAFPAAAGGEAMGRLLAGVPSVRPVPRAPALDPTAATAALGRDPVYIAPGSVARIDLAPLRRELAGTSIVVAVAPYLPENAARTDGPLAEWAAAQRRQVVLVTGLQVTMLTSQNLFTPDVGDVRDALQRNDVTRQVLRAVRHLRDGATVHASWWPRTVPPDRAQLDRIVAGLRRSRLHMEPGVTERVAADQVQALVSDIAFRTVVLPPLLGDDEPALLPALAMAFPGELIVVVHGRWLAATGAPARQLAAAQASVLGRGVDYLLRYGWAPDNFLYAYLLRVKELRASRSYPPPDAGGIDARGISLRLAPWIFVGFALLLGGGSVAIFVRRTVRERRASARAVRTGRAELLARLARVGGDVRSLDVLAAPGPVAEEAARLLAMAAERHATARPLTEHADTPEEVDAVRSTLTEAEAYTGDARKLLKLPAHDLAGGR